MRLLLPLFHLLSLVSQLFGHIIIIASLLPCSSIIPSVQGLNNGLGLIPPMGWNSWNAFHCDIDEIKIMNAATLLVPLQALGYNYLNLDDCWMSHNRTDSGRYMGDPVRFPSGMAALGEYLHSLGFRFGIYTSAGTMTCAHFPGSLGYEDIDAQTFADWGVDYLKYDNCFSSGIPGIDRYTKMRDALNATGRPIYFSLCQWGTEDSWQWAPAVGNSWRTTGDILPNWASIRANFWESQQHAQRGGPGAWLDPDMLEVGNGNLSEDENRAHFSLWCLAKAPLLLGMDLASLSAETKAILSNKNLIRINQDPKSPQATCFVGCSVHASWSVLATTTSDGSTVVLVINWQDVPLKLKSLTTKTFGVVPAPRESLAVQDLWTGKLTENGHGTSIRIPVLPAHSCLVYELKIIANSQHDILTANVEVGL